MTAFAQFLTWLGRLPVAGAGLRGLARFYREGSVARIRTGLAAGMLWRRHHRYVNGYWLGHYELPLQESLHRALAPGQVFFDAGANAGFFTLIAARLVGPTGRCIAFEPLPENAQSIREQIELNSLSQVQVFEGAVTEEPGEVTISFQGPGDPGARLAGSGGGVGTVRVPAITLDLAARRFGRPDVVKMDIEGAEGLALQGAAGILRDGKTRWILEVHSAEAWESVRKAFGASQLITDLSGSPVSVPAAYPVHVLVKPQASLSSQVQP